MVCREKEGAATGENNRKEAYLLEPEAAICHRSAQPGRPSPHASILNWLLPAPGAIIDDQSIWAYRWVVNGGRRAVQGHLPGFDNGNSLAAERQLAERIQQARPPDGRPWSICEARLDEADYQALQSWSQTLPPSRAEYMTGPRAIVLMAFLAETARRRPAGSGFWKPITEEFSIQTRSKLFHAHNDQPREPVHEAIQEAARLGLRNVLERDRDHDDPSHRWRGTVELQFGFTPFEAQSGLADWLVGQNQPVAVKRLLTDPDLRCRSFEDHWQTLRAFRRGQLTDGQLRGRLEQSPWVPAGGWQLLADAARRVREAHCSAAAGHTQGADPNALDDPDEPEVLDESSWRIVWDLDGELRLVVTIADLACAGLEAPRYRLQIGGRTRATILRSSAGTYTCGSGGRIELLCDRPILDVSLVDHTGRIAATQVLTLWDAAAELNIFSAAGRPYPLNRAITAGSECILQWAEGLELQPSPDGVRAAGRLWGRCVIVGAETPRLLDPAGHVVWTPVRGTPRARAPVSELLKVHLDGDANRTVELGDPLYFRFDHPARLKVASVRLDGEDVPFERTINGRVGPVVVSPRLAMEGVWFHVGLRTRVEPNGVLTMVRVEAERLPVAGIAGFEPESGRWSAHDAARPIEVAELAAARLFVPPAWGPSAALMEGAAYRRAVGRPRATQLERAQLMGAPLWLRRSPYNCDERPVRLALAVSDRGVVRSVGTWPDGEGMLVVGVDGIEEIGERHAVVAWSPRRGTFVARGGEIRPGPAGAWFVDWRWGRIDEGEAVAVAVAHDGAWLGLGVRGPLDELLRRDPDASYALDAVRHAALIRWSRLPALQEHERGRPILALFAERHPHEFLGAWHRAVGLEDWGLFQDAARRDADASIVRELLSGWDPSPGDDTVAPLLKHFDRGGDPWDRLVEELIEHDPLLVGKLLRTNWMCRDEEARRRRLRVWLDRIRDEQWPSGEGGPGPIPSEHFARHLIKRALGVLDGRPIGEFDREPYLAENLATALDVGTFRSRLAHEVLRYIEARIDRAARPRAGAARR